MERLVNQEEHGAVIASSMPYHPDHMKNSEIRVDIVVERPKPMTFWGQITDYRKRPMGNVVVRLVKIENDQKDIVASTTTDQEGWYEIKVLYRSWRATYKIEVCQGKYEEHTQTTQPTCDPKLCNTCKNFDIHRKMCKLRLRNYE